MIYENELYHHGVKGMKWGVRRENRYRQSELRAIDRKYNVKRYDKKVAKMQNKYNKALKKADSDNRIKKAQSKLTEAKINRAFNEGMRAVESSKIKNMSVFELMEENRKVQNEKKNIQTRNYTNYLVANQIGGVQVADVYNDSEFKTNLRVSGKERDQVYKKAQNAR